MTQSSDRNIFISASLSLVGFVCLIETKKEVIGSRGGYMQPLSLQSKVSC